MDDLRKEILGYLYALWPYPAELNLAQLSQAKGIAPVKAFQSVVRFMVEEGVIWNTSGGNYAITAEGVIEAEKRGLGSSDEIKRKRLLREELLLTLKTHQDETCGLSDFIISAFVSDQGITEVQFWGVSRFLLAQGLVNQSGSVPPVLTALGMESARKIRVTRSRADSFSAIESLSPSARGLRFQEMIGTMLTEEEWRVETSVRASGEEVDVIIARGREYYLIECRWRSQSISAREIREFFGKLENRVEVRGIIISMSGFTSDAIVQAEGYLGKRLILLFGPQNVFQWVQGEVLFEELLDEKFHEAISRKSLPFV